MKKSILVLFVLLLSVTSQALDTSGYVTIKEIKAQGTSVGVYMTDSQHHQCSGGHVTRFLVSYDTPERVSLIYAAFMAGKAVSLKYTCSSDGYPWVSIVRVR